MLYVLQGKPSFIKDMAKSMVPKLQAALDDWKTVDGTTIAQLLDPGIKDTLLSGDEKSAAREKFEVVFAKYGIQRDRVTKSLLKPAGSSIRDAMIETLRATANTSVPENEEYLSTATVPNVPVLSWWKGATHFPVAQRMARDFLAVPASSVQCERENSKAKYVITDIRNRLSSQTVQATLCLKSWNVLLNEQDTGAVTLD